MKVRMKQASFVQGAHCPAGSVIDWPEGHVLPPHVEPYEEEPPPVGELPVPDPETDPGTETEPGETEGNHGSGRKRKR